ncbi:MAG: crossover junction endodeoxyribonuclease RuvC [Calditrichaeota bacterium]|nr:crossover junction endodeoxyribonuclease RuvC [Calditrichota bacterium]MCB0289242.1 crossover junction endodeoxyribonuclease RuvC [Calditrichota bacterium]MCB0294624.1 crossover junction endodeoxyribonuclease RuvC [Calditrichota bacterium]MCB0302167.1 crossover junction endodeoxyribonuclease RuvC [Calditrichota bacterium]MCB0313694.1 crossover junction endodeoxyribonuclease RuvC [Calditrichota bacterium]
MLKQTERILAIDPGAREMGVVVLEDTDLIYHGVKNLKTFRPEAELKKAVTQILSKLIVEYDVKTMVVENGWFSQESSPLFRTCFDTVQEVGRKRRRRLAIYAPKTIRKFICGDGKATKKRTARILATQYPELEIYLEQNYRWKEKYWLNVFDALAAGLTHVRQQENHLR